MIILHSDTLTAHILPYGATLAGLWYRDCPRSLVLGSDDTDSYRNDLCFFGAIVGPVANRIRDAQVTIGDTQWILPANEGTTCLHSGPNGLHARDWQVTEQSGTLVRLACEMAHGDCGLPGNRWFEASYHLSAAGQIDLNLTAKSDRDTLVNMAHHPYWQLDQGPTVARHMLQVNAQAFTPVDADTLPTGQVADVQGTAYDFQDMQRVPADRPLDANLVLAPQPREHLHPAATLTASNGMRLEIETDQAGLQVYNGSGIPCADVPLHTGQRLTPFAGIALEPQAWPDAPNYPNFHAIRLQAGDTYRQHLRYKIAKN
ncbi:MAG: aldose epimerase family protein [Roseobacter sp.]